MARPMRGRRGEVQAVFDLLADRPSAVNLAVHWLIHRLTHLIGGLGRIVSPFSITKRSSACTKGRRRRVQAALGPSGYYAKCQHPLSASALTKRFNGQQSLLIEHQGLRDVGWPASLVPRPFSPHDGCGFAYCSPRSRHLRKARRGTNCGALPSLDRD